MRAKEFIMEVPTSGTTGTTGTINTAIGTGTPKPQSATVSRTTDAQGRRITKRADGSTTTSGAMGSVTRDKTGFKTQEKTPRLGGVSVTRKFDPNEKNLDMDQTSDDPTSATTNYQNKVDGTKINVTSKGDAERETGRDMLGKDPVTGNSNIQKIDISRKGISLGVDNKKGIDQKGTTATMKYSLGPNQLTFTGKKK